MNLMSVDEAKAWLRQREFVEWGEWLVELLSPDDEAEWLKAVNSLRHTFDGQRVETIFNSFG